MDAESTRRAVENVVDRFERTVGGHSRVRDEIFESWRRCVLDGLSARRLVVPYVSDIDTHGRLAWAADSVIDRVADDLQGTPMALILTDERGQVLERREGDSAVAGLTDRIGLAPGFLYGEDLVGTNAIGIALELRRPSVVVGDEHFADVLTAMGCAAAPVTDPATGRVIGVVDLTCGAEHVTSLMLPLTKRIAWEIEQRLLDDASVEQRVLREHFLAARRSSRGAILAINESSMLVSGTPAAVVQPSDREPIWQWASGTIGVGDRNWSHLVLTSGRTVGLRCEPVRDGARVLGAIVHLDLGALPSVDTSAADGAAGDRATGWSSLTSTERVVADQVSRGLTNSEIAFRLVLSPHTVDYHLRQIFRKMDVRSRVDLTRAVMESAAGTTSVDSGRAGFTPEM